jgi:uncharacterized protein (DUF1786 family)
MIKGALLAADIGGGTQDLLIWEPGQPVHNAVKLVLPAPTQIMARRIRTLTAEGRPLFLGGRLMGGGAVSLAVRDHLARGFKVFASTQAAYTLNDSLKTIRQWGVILADDPPPGAARVELGDLDLEGLSRLLDEYAVPRPVHFAVAVQDHGFNPEGSNRRFRFQHWENFLAAGGRLTDLAFFDPPLYFTRMRAIKEQLPQALVMDTCAAGVRGALLDPAAAPHQAEGLMVVNLGNAHTFAALVQGDRLRGIYEHHTGLPPAKLFEQLARFQAGRLTNDEVFADQGHGCAYGAGYPGDPPFSFTVITGPQRRLARGWPGGVLAAPLGDMMLTGCFGLVAAFFERQNLDVSFLHELW